MFFGVDLDSLLYALSVASAVLALGALVYVANAGGDGL